MNKYIFLFVCTNVLNLHFQCKAENLIMEVELDFELEYKTTLTTIKDHTSLVFCGMILSKKNSKIQGKFDATNFNGNHCTHLVFSYLSLTDEYEVKNDSNIDRIQKFISIGKKYPHLKLLFEVSVKNDEVEAFMKTLIESQKSRQKFVTNMRTTTQFLGIDGFVIDSNMYNWAPNMTALAHELKAEFKEVDLIIAVEINLWKTQLLWQLDNIAGISRLFDFTIILLSGMNDEIDRTVKFAGYGAPLYLKRSNVSYIYRNLKILLSRWRVNPRNIILKYDIATSVLVLKNETSAEEFPFGYGSETVSKKIPSPWRKNKRWGYDEICSTVLSDIESWKMYWDDTAKVPFLRNNKQWINFENARSMVAKAELVNYFGFKGIGVYFLNYDDVARHCSSDSYPLLKSANWGLSKSKSMWESQQCSLFTNDTEPIISFSSQELNISNGGSAEINCTVDALSPFELKWIQTGGKTENVVVDGNNIDILTSESQSFCNVETLTSTLKIRSIHADKTYVCYLSYQNGTRTKEIEFQIFTASTLTNVKSVKSWQPLWTIVALLNLAILIGITMVICVLVRRSQMKTYIERKEISNLLNGNKTLNTETATNLGKATIDLLQIPFDKTYEIAKNTFIIDHSKILGKGEFGVVCKGSLQGIEGVVAFKTVRPDNGTVSLRTLVSELKIMLYIGYHDNLVKLLGAYTAEIKSGILFVAMEFCELGSLESFLRKNKFLFLECPILNPKHEGPSSQSLLVRDAHSQPLYSIQSLLKWSLQISTALEYLGTKNVVHMDLATRNVLLTSQGEAKVTDFGLSRRTYKCTEYIKTAKDSLPWRLLALECLKINTFSSQSDVWAYGITLWEMFSLGDVPYPTRAATADFVQDLENGLRNFKPKYASDEIYDLMIRCWNIDPHQRPTFSYLKLIFACAVSNGATNIYLQDPESTLQTSVS